MSVILNVTATWLNMMVRWVAGYSSSDIDGETAGLGVPHLHIRSIQHVKKYSSFNTIQYWGISRNLLLDPTNPFIKIHGLTEDSRKAEAPRNTQNIQTRFDQYYLSLSDSIVFH